RSVAARAEAGEAVERQVEHVTIAALPDRPAQHAVAVVEIEHHAGDGAAAGDGQSPARVGRVVPGPGGLEARLAGGEEVGLQALLAFLFSLSEPPRTGV